MRATLNEPAEPLEAFPCAGGSRGLRKIFGDDLIEGDHGGLTAGGADAGASDSGVETRTPTRDAGAGCDCLSGTYLVSRKTCLNNDCSASVQLTSTFDVAACNGTVVCHVGGSVHSCMSTPDGVFRVYVDTLGYRQYIFSTRGCSDPWVGVFAQEGGGPAEAITATWVP